MRYRYNLWTLIAMFWLTMIWVFVLIGQDLVTVLAAGICAVVASILSTTSGHY